MSLSLTNPKENQALLLYSISRSLPNLLQHVWMLNETGGGMSATWLCLSRRAG